MQERQRKESSGPVVPTLVLLGLALLSAMAFAAMLQDDGGSEPVQGWFTTEQADRGDEAYQEHCARCHSPDLRARSAYISLYGYPSLTGSYFRDRWQGQSVHTLYEVIEQTMPLDAPNSLDAETYAEVTAHILRENGFPAGDRPLPTGNAEPGRLRGLVLEWQPTRPRTLDAEPVTPDEDAAAEASRAEAAATGEEQEPSDDGDGPPTEQPIPEGGAWYTEAQAARAQDPYVRHCARCHGRAMQGLGVAPSLAGANFIERWQGEPVAELYRIASTLMPLDDPGALEPPTYADLLALVLQENGFEAGEQELPPDFEALQELEIRPELADVPEVQ